MKRIGIDVSVLADEQMSGVGVYCFNLLDALLKINHSDKFILFAITPLNSGNKNIYYFKKYSNVEIKVYRLPIQLFRRLFLFWQKINWPLIEDLIGTVDIFHSFNSFIPPQKKGKPVATFYDLSSIIYPHYHQHQTSQLDLERFERMAKRSDLIFTISQFSKDEFLKKWSGKRVEVIYPATREIFCQKITMDKKEKIFKKYSLEEGYLLSVGTVEPRKNLERLIEAFYRVVRQGMKNRSRNQVARLRFDNRQPSAGLSASHFSNTSDFTALSLVIIGSKGWLADDIYALPKKLGIEDRVRFLDYVADEDLPILYAGASALVYPSLYEGFGLPVVEAFCMGLPVVTSNNSSLAEISNGAAILVDPADPQKIADGIKKVFSNNRFRNQLIEKGRQRAKLFSWEKSARQLLKSYYLL